MRSERIVATDILGRFVFLPLIWWSALAPFSAKQQLSELRAGDEYIGWVKPSISGWIACLVIMMIAGQVDLQVADFEEYFK